MSWKGIRAVNHAGCQQCNPELPLVAQRVRMRMTATLSDRLEAIKRDRHKDLAPASAHDIPAWESIISGREESGSVRNDGHSESYA